MPGPKVHLELTARWAEEEGLPPGDAAAVAFADLEMDAVWPGRRHPLRHFNPTAGLFFAPLWQARALSLAGSPSAKERDLALTWLGRALHARQDAIAHGVLGLAHLRVMSGLTGRHPDVWETMPPRLRSRIERATRRRVRAFVGARGR